MNDDDPKLLTAPNPTELAGLQPLAILVFCSPPRILVCRLPIPKRRGRTVAPEVAEATKMLHRAELSHLPKASR
jgi:hypothetical protein